MNDLIAWVSLRDEEGQLHARFCPTLQILVIKKRGKEHRFSLGDYQAGNERGRQASLKSTVAIEQKLC